MRKYIMIGLVGILCGIGAVSCGNDAGFDAVLVMPKDATFTTPPDGSSFGFTGMQILVQKSSDDSTPVPDAKIQLEPFASSGQTILYSDVNHLNPVANTGGAPGPSWSTTTDNNGMVRVYVSYVTPTLVCPTSITGVMGFTVLISAAQADWTGTATLECP